MSLRLNSFRIARVSEQYVRRKHTSSETLPKFNSAASFKLTHPPNANWDLEDGASRITAEGKQWAEDVSQGWKSWDASKMPVKDCYGLLTSAVVPRPIAFVSTVSPEGTPNLAPMRKVSHNPPLLSISLLLGKKRPKDTRENILATKEFTVNMISESFVEAANACAVEAPEHVNEWIVSGLTPEPSVAIKSPRVRESAVQMECELYQSLDISSPGSEEVTTTLILGSIKHIHIRNSVLGEDGKSVDPAKLRPVARLAGGTYSRLGEGFDLERTSWKTFKDRIEQMHK